MIGTKEMSHLRRKSLRESTTVTLDPSFDLVVLVRRKVVRVTENDLAKGLVLAHGEDVVEP
jgi:RNase P protein component